MLSLGLKTREVQLTTSIPHRNHRRDGAAPRTHCWACFFVCHRLAAVSFSVSWIV
ncbi:hypothetical protein X801_04906 [Opisthorchis viverrini]|uniref:Uncharacterized protein n=1 Tax=Opisthorchis viverrini TaxID=6198 RepID=A0A1S8WXQ0_OPIVI|nr:hypothetical protein X801_04906 [Opisthorchis viverrini]